MIYIIYFNLVALFWKTFIENNKKKNPLRIRHILSRILKILTTIIWKNWIWTINWRDTHPLVKGGGRFYKTSFENHNFNLTKTIKVRILTPVHTTMSHCEFIEPSHDDEKFWLWAWDTIITLSYQTNSISAVTKLSLLI